MMDGKWGLLAGVFLFFAAGCAGPVATIETEGSDLDVFLETLENRIVQLNTNIERLGREMAALQQAPDTPDPILRELQALDLAGWQLHQQQWVLQREHLRFTTHQLRLALERPQDKSQLLSQWAARQQEYQTVLADLRRQRLQLEHQYTDVEARVVERFLH